MSSRLARSPAIASIPPSPGRAAQTGHQAAPAQGQARNSSRALARVPWHISCVMRRATMIPRCCSRSALSSPRAQAAATRPPRRQVLEPDGATRADCGGSRKIAHQAQAIAFASAVNLHATDLPGSGSPARTRTRNGGGKATRKRNAALCAGARASAKAEHAKELAEVNRQSSSSNTDVDRG